MTRKRRWCCRTGSPFSIVDEIEQVGTGRQLYDDPATLFVGRFIGNSSVLRGEARSNATGTALCIGDETVTVPGRVAASAYPVILLRPEKLVIRRIGQDGQDGRNRLSGTVSEAIYLGSGSKYEVRLADGSTAIVRPPLSDQSYAIGDRVELCFRGEDAKLLADQSSADTTLT